MSATINDVRLALWDAYRRLEARGFDAVKDADGLCEVEYPNFWSCDTPEQFAEPRCLMIYAYALGPNRRHYIFKGKRKRRLREGEWEAPDIFGYALELIAEWLAENEAAGATE